MAEAVKQMGLEHAVVTSVTRDDLPDGGAAQFAATVAALRARLPAARAEILVPDFAGDENAWRVAVDAGADVFNHNVETVPRLYAEVRAGADYARSLALLAYARARRGPDAPVKSGLMVGLGETADEILAVAADLRGAGVSMVTVGQYLSPVRGGTRPVARFVPPEEFADLAARLRALGFRSVGCGPWVRSSYGAEEAFRAAAANTP